MTTSALQTKPVPAISGGWTRDQIELIKTTVAKGTTDDELRLFCYVAQRTGLDPLAKQIYAIKRWNSKEGRDVMSLQTGIDGYRIIAARTGQHVGTSKATFEVEAGSVYPLSATVTVYRLINGEPRSFEGTARWSECVQTNKDGSPNSFWARMPYLMLEKVAECLALRRGFPAEMAGLSPLEETEQVEPEQRLQPVVTLAPQPATSPQPASPKLIESPTPAADPGSPVITEPQRKRLFALAGKAKLTQEQIKSWLLKTYQYGSSRDITQAHYDAICQAIEQGKVTAPAPDLITVREVETLMAAVAKENIPVAAFGEFVLRAYGCQAVNLPLKEYGHVLDQVTGGYVAQWCQDNLTAEEEQQAQA